MHARVILGVGKVSSLEGCPLFKGVLIRWNPSLCIQPRSSTSCQITEPLISMVIVVGDYWLVTV